MNSTHDHPALIGLAPLTMERYIAAIIGEQSDDCRKPTYFKALLDATSGLTAPQVYFSLRELITSGRVHVCWYSARRGGEVGFSLNSDYAAAE